VRIKAASGAATPVAFAALRIRSRSFAIWCPLKVGGVVRRFQGFNLANDHRVMS
jgi:hypothetical protein